MGKSAILQPQKYYRLPWSLTDNGISWLEVTDACNLTCEGCYRPHEKKHKSLTEISEMLDVFAAKRKSHCMSIAGGDPLVHPQIVDIVAMISSRGWKPILNTNGLALTPGLLQKLKAAGVSGFTFHIDTTQKRHDSKGALQEKDHNHLRQKFAQMLSDIGGIACSFNQTVSIDTLDQIPDTVKWAQQHPDIVHTVVFILFRAPKFVDSEFDFYANGQKISFCQSYEQSPWGGKKLLRAGDVVSKIREVLDDFAPHSYLSGTINPDSTKWLLATRVATKETNFGHFGPRFMEIVQNVGHFFSGKWPSYTHPSLLAFGKLTALLFSPFDPNSRKIVKNFLKAILKKPAILFQSAYLQTFTIIQPVDMLKDGRMDMCDGCPDMTVHNGELYWSCRLEEVKEYGQFVSAVPQSRVRPKETKKIFPPRTGSLPTATEETTLLN